MGEKLIVKPVLNKPKLAVDIDETIVYLLGHFLDYYNDKYGTDFSEDDFFSYRWWEVLGIKKEQAYAEAEEYIKTKMRRYEPEVPTEWYHLPRKEREKGWDFDIEELCSRYEAACERAKKEGRYEQGYGDLSRFDIEFVKGAEAALNLLYFFFDLYAISDRSPLLHPDTFNISSWLYIEDSEGGNYFPQFGVEEDNGGGVLLLPMEKIFLTNEENMTKAQLCKELGIDRIIDDNPEVAYDCAKQGIQTIVIARPWNKSIGEHPLIKRAEDWQEICDILVPKKIKLPEINQVTYI